MCEPTTIALGIAALSAASAGAGAIGQRNQTKRQFDTVAEQRAAQNEEIASGAGRKIGERIKQGRAERARMRVAGGEAGISGNSFAASLMDAAFQQSEDVAGIQKDTEFAQRGSEAGFQSALASVKNPGAIETTLNIASAGASGYSSGLQIGNARAGKG